MFRDSRNRTVVQMKNLGTDIQTGVELRNLHANALFFQVLCKSQIRLASSSLKNISKSRPLMSSKSHCHKWNLVSIVHACDGRTLRRF